MFLLTSRGRRWTRMLHDLRHYLHRFIGGTRSVVGLSDLLAEDPWVQLGFKKVQRDYDRLSALVTSSATSHPQKKKTLSKSH